MNLRFAVTPEPVIDSPHSRLDVSLNNTPFRSVPLAQTGTLIDPGRRESRGRRRYSAIPSHRPQPAELLFRHGAVAAMQCQRRRQRWSRTSIPIRRSICRNRRTTRRCPTSRTSPTRAFPLPGTPICPRTAVVMPDQTTPDDTEAYLETMALFGEATGYPTLQAAVARPGDVSSMANRDLLLIGSFARQPLLAGWTSQRRHYHRERRDAARSNAVGGSAFNSYSIGATAAAMLPK